MVLKKSFNSQIMETHHPSFILDETALECEAFAVRKIPKHLFTLRPGLGNAEFEPLPDIGSRYDPFSYHNILVEIIDDYCWANV